jgi:ABC-type phosphate/phosphonate transport system substrate-binding protein
MRKVLGLGCLGLLVVICLVPLVRTSQAADGPASLRLGLVGSLFRETPKSMVELLSQPLKTLLEAQTGMTGRIGSTADALTLARQLNEKQIDLAVFHGFEFAWVKQKYPDLQPLVVVSSTQRLQAHLLVAGSSKAATCADLQGKTLALPRRSREHVHLFLERRCAGGKDPKDFFGKIARSPDTEDAIEDLLDGSVQAVLLDHADLEAYRQAKPEQYRKLRQLLQSEPFPSGVLSCKEGALAEDTVERLRSGLLSAHQNRRGRDLLSLCRMAGFEVPTQDFEQALQAIAKAYPPPASK